MKVRGSSLLGLRGLLLIIENEPIIKKYIIERLMKEQFCGIIDLRGNRFEAFQGCEGGRTIWLEEIDPARGTGWIVKQSIIDLVSQDRSYIYFPNFHGTWAVIERKKGEYNFLPDNSPQIISIDEWGEYFLSDSGRSSEPVLPGLIEIESTKDCKGGKTKGATYWFCEKDLLILKNSHSEEFFIGGETEIKIKKQVKNPRAYWLQPYALVKDRLGDELSSNFIIVEMPSSSISFISLKHINVFDRQNILEIKTKGPSYISFSKQPDFTLLHKLRLLSDKPIFTGLEMIPHVEVKPPTVVIRKFEMKRNDITWFLKMEISYPLDIPSNLRISVRPPFYIASYNFNFETNFSETIGVHEMNSIDFPLIGLDYLKLEMSIKRKKLKLLKS